MTRLSSTLWTIQELLESILWHPDLSGPDQLSCLTVCNAWHTALLPHYWKSISWNPSNSKADPTIDIVGVPKHFHLIRHLTIDNRPGVDQLTNLGISGLLSIRATIQTSQDWSLDFMDIFRLVKTNPGLLQLIVTGTSMSFSLDELIRILPNPVSHLQDLQLQSVFFSDRTMEKLLEKCPDLNRFSMTDYADAGNNPIGDFRIRKLNKVKRLEICFPNPLVYSVHLTKVERMCCLLNFFPNLEDLNLTINGPSIPLLMETLKELKLNLKRLELGNNGQTQDWMDIGCASIMDLVSQRTLPLPQQQRFGGLISFRGPTNQFGLAQVQALSQHATTLTRIDLYRSWFAIGHIGCLQLLATCPNLVEAKIVLKLSMIENLDQKPVACTRNLKRLWISFFVGFDPTTSEAMKTFNDRQRVIYGFVEKFTYLQEIQFWYLSNRGVPVLTMELDSGLTRWGKLKDLRCLDLSCFGGGVMLTQPVLEWMLKSWPKLKELFTVEGGEQDQELMTWLKGKRSWIEWSSRGLQE